MKKLAFFALLVILTYFSAVVIINARQHFIDSLPLHELPLKEKRVATGCVPERGRLQKYINCRRGERG